MEALISEKTTDIQEEIRILGRQIEEGDDSELLHWVIPESLACAHRPLRYNRLYGGSGHNISSDATPFVVEWAIHVRYMGIKSIISLMHDKDLSYYKDLELGPGNLLDFYQRQGFNVTHLPWEDPFHSKSNFKTKEKKLKQIRILALKEYDKLEKPVIIQCSAGYDRTAPVAAYIYMHRMPSAS